MHLVILAAALAYVELVTALPRPTRAQGFPSRRR
jgi:hypothetical protein